MNHQCSHTVTDARTTANNHHPALPDSISRAIDYLLSKQSEEGWWMGELEGNTALESEYILLMRFLGRGDENKLAKAAAYIRSKQMEDGGWPLFPGGPADPSATIMAYFALKLTGATADEPDMVKAQRVIEKAGGVGAANGHVRLYLAALGQIPWSSVPAAPPEMLLLPKWSYLNIYAISSWSRTLLVPLSIIRACKPVTEVDGSQGISELFGPTGRRRIPLGGRRSPISWRNFFLAVDKIITAAERMRLLPLRKRAIAKAEQWILEHSEHSSGLGAAFTPMAYALIALRALGYSDSHPRVRRTYAELARLEIEEKDSLRLQPCMSPVWDTAMAVNTLSEADLGPNHPAMIKAAQWLVNQEIGIRGDWAVKRPQLEPGGWCSEWKNDFYPDIDDTAMVLMALEKTADVPGKADACRRGLTWLLGMQGSDGGWASCDMDNNRRIFESMPYADQCAMLDPSTSDISGRVLEMLSFYGIGLGSRAARRGLDFLTKQQERDGSWYGRWGVNYIHGTWQAIRGMTRIGIPAADPAVRRGANWLISMQNTDGGWGESCMSYYDPTFKSKSASTASQTAWALMGLICAGRTNSEVVRRGVEYLLSSQNEDGTWEEDGWTECRFPRVLFFRHHLYRHAFPLMALGMYSRALEAYAPEPRSSI